jgi:hypothetical protein
LGEILGVLVEKDQHGWPMRAPAWRARLARMPATRRAQLTLELELGSEPVAGVLRDPDNTPRPFVGWIALTRAIELALERVSATAITSENA